MTNKKRPVVSVDRHRVLIIDDHPLIRQGLVRLLNEEPDIKVCGEAGTGPEALELTLNLKPNLAIVDLRLPNTDGIDLISELMAHAPDLLILVLTMRDEQIYAERALSAGAKGYIMKGSAPEKVLVAIRQVLNGQIHLSEAMTETVLHRFVGGGKPEQSTRIDLLSRRELQVMTLVCEGMGPKAIGEKLHLSTRTVETYRTNIKIKLGLENAADLRRYAIAWLQRER